MKEKYIEIEENLQCELLGAVEQALGRDLTDAEADKVRSLITDADITAQFGE